MGRRQASVTVTRTCLPVCTSQIAGGCTRPLGERSSNSSCVHQPNCGWMHLGSARVTLNGSCVHQPNCGWMHLGHAHISLNGSCVHQPNCGWMHLDRVFVVGRLSCVHQPNCGWMHPLLVFWRLSVPVCTSQIAGGCTRSARNMIRDKTLTPRARRRNHKKLCLVSVHYGRNSPLINALLNL